MESSKIGVISMEEQSRLARFESMRKGPGLNGQASRNQKLFLKHNELEKQCQRQVKRFEREMLMAQSNVRKKEKMIRRQEKIFNENLRNFEVRKDRFDAFFQEIDKRRKAIEEKQRKAEVDKEIVSSS